MLRLHAGLEVRHDLSQAAVAWTGLLEELKQGPVDNREPLHAPEQGGEVWGAWALYSRKPWIMQLTLWLKHKLVSSYWSLASPH